MRAALVSLLPVTMFRTGSVRTSIHHGELSAAGVISRESKFTCQRDKDEGPRIFLEDEGEEPICRIKPAGYCTYKVDVKDMYYCFASLELEASLSNFLRSPTVPICIRSRFTSSDRINQLDTNSLIAQCSSKLAAFPAMIVIVAACLRVTGRWITSGLA